MTRSGSHSVSSQGVFSVADFDDGLDCTELDGAVPPRTVRACLALMYWGIHTGDSMAEGIVIAALAPGAAIFVWWKLVAPKSASWLTDTGRFLVKMAVFGLSALALAAAGQTLLAISFAVVAVLNASFLLVAPKELTTSRLQDRPPKGPRLGASSAPSHLFPPLGPPPPSAPGRRHGDLRGKPRVVHYLL